MPGFAWYLRKLTQFGLAAKMQLHNILWKTHNESVTSSNVFPRHEHIPIPVTTTRLIDGKVAPIRNCEIIAVRGDVLVKYVRRSLRFWRPFEVSKAVDAIANRIIFQNTDCILSSPTCTCTYECGGTHCTPAVGRKIGNTARLWQ